MIDKHFTEFVNLIGNHPLPFFHEIEIIFDVNYLHIQLPDKSDVYLTRFGIPLVEQFAPPTFLADSRWFHENAEPLEGTSSTFKVTPEANGADCAPLVVKWNRMGRFIPADDESEEFAGAAFNSPFEEFSLVMELRHSYTFRSDLILTQRPIGIYVPSASSDLWRMGRQEYIMDRKISQHQDEVVLDKFRDYVVIYEWVDGIDAAEAARSGFITDEMMAELTIDADRRMRNKGYVVRDRKPHHVIVRPRKNGRLAQTKRDGILFAVVDYELMERLPSHEKKRNETRRLLYHKKQRDRFMVKPDTSSRIQFKYTSVLGVDYIYTHAESTGGVLWVVGRDVGLVDYFYPERWEGAHKTRLSESHEIYHTVTKDDIHLVWKVSKAGMIPNVDPFHSGGRRLMHFGYNTPFEEVSLAVKLGRSGIRVVYPRAIYEAGGSTHISESLIDPRRYEKYRGHLSPDGEPAFKLGKTYFLLWGFYNGSDEQLAEKDGAFLESVDALRAFRRGIITESRYLTIMRRKKQRLFKAGVEDLNLQGNHLLLSIAPSGKLLQSGDGYPDVRICNFEFLKET